jgi:hypothetical protein
MVERAEFEVEKLRVLLNWTFSSKIAVTPNVAWTFPSKSLPVVDPELKITVALPFVGTAGKSKFNESAPVGT